MQCRCQHKYTDAAYRAVNGCRRQLLEQTSTNADNTEFVVWHLLSEKLLGKAIVLNIVCYRADIDWTRTQTALMGNMLMPWFLSVYAVTHAWLLPFRWCPLFALWLAAED